MLKKLFWFAVVIGIVALVVFVPQVNRVVLEPFTNPDVTGVETSGEGPGKYGEVVKVYVPRGGKYYHTKDCPDIQGKNAVPTPLDKAKAIFDPHRACNPPR